MRNDTKQAIKNIAQILEISEKYVRYDDREKVYVIENCVSENSLEVIKFNKDIQFDDLLDYSLKFHKCEFLESVIGYEKQFRHKLIFTNVTFKKILNLAFSIFNNEIFFFNVTLEESIDCRQCEFKGAFKAFGVVFLKRAIFENSTFEKEVHFGKEIDDRNIEKSNMFGSCSFETAFFENCNFFDSVYFKNNEFKQLFFKNSIFKDNVYFNNSHFYDFADFHECEFEKTACFYGATFHNKAILNFSQAIFKENLNFVNVKCNFEFKDLKALIENDDKTFSSKVANDFRDSFRIIKNALVKDNNLLEAQEYHKMELYCKELELQNTLKQEKPKNKLEEIKKNNNINYKVWLEGLLLLVYRYTSDHHTNLVRIINVTVSMIGLYGLLLYGCILFSPFVMTGQGFIYYIIFCAFFFSVFLVFGLPKKTNKLFMILIRLLCLFVFMLLVAFITDEFGTHHTILIGLTSLLYVMLLIGYFTSLTPKRWVSNIVHTFTYICFFAVFTTLPQLINPFLGIFKSDSIYNVSHFENQLHQIKPQELINIANILNNQTQFDPYALFVTDTNQAKQIIRDYKETILKTPSLHIQQNPINISQTLEVLHKAILKDFVLINTIKSTSVVYSIILLLCIFSLQKTARKNSIIPH